MRCSLEQMLEEGFYHADPHPGNLLKTRDGRLAYLDFGMMGQVDATIRRWGRCAQRAVGKRAWEGRRRCT